MESFSLDLARFGQRAVNNAERIVKKIALDMHSSIILRMPVDTGRARANTQVSLQTLPTDSTPDTDRTGRNTIASARRKASHYRLGDIVYIYNNVEYILNLEYGSSIQAPAGMFRISYHEIVSHLGAQLS